MERFKDKGDTIYAFQDEFLVQCPSCSSCATVRRIDPTRIWYYTQKLQKTQFLQETGFLNRSEERRVGKEC